MRWKIKMPKNQTATLMPISHFTVRVSGIDVCIMSVPLLFAELDKHAPSRLRMDEGDQTVMRAGLGFIAQHLNAFGFELLHDFANILYTQTNMMNSGSAFFE